MISAHLSSLLLMAIPITLSAFTHLWNPIGFPNIHFDEGYYMGRAMHALKGQGPQESENRYDHPYFGHLFLASIFKIIGYPDSLNPIANGNINSIQELYLVPRILMGLLAVLNTFIIYKIAELRYNRKVAFIASLLFAITPLGWLTRWILLDSIQLPFLLSSILFAVYLNKHHLHNNNNHSSYFVSFKNRNALLVLFSGIFLGLAIFAKIPAFTMIPLTGLLIFTNTRRSWKLLGLWLIPVISIPMIWPAYAISFDEFENWMDGVSWQATGRPDKPLLNLLPKFFSFDPILFILGFAGIALAIVQKDILVLLWAIPFLVFLYLIGFVSLFHMISILPVFCIAAAKVIVDISKRISSSKKVLRHQILPYAMVTAIGLFGLVNTVIQIIPNYTSTEFQVTAFVAKHLTDISSNNNQFGEGNINNNNSNNEVIVIGSPYYFWIPRYVFDNDHHEYKNHHSRMDIKSQKALLIADSSFMDIIAENSKKSEILQKVYNNSRTINSVENIDEYHNYDNSFVSRVSKGKTLMSSEVNNPIKDIEIRTNY